jgi:hypothetical protein
VEEGKERKEKKSLFEPIRDKTLLLRPTSRDTPGEIFFFFGKIRKEMTKTSGGK